MALHGRASTFLFPRLGSDRLVEGHLFVESAPADRLAEDVIGYFDSHPALGLLILETTRRHFALIFRGQQDVSDLMVELRASEPGKWRLGPPNQWFTQIANGDQSDPQTASQWRPKDLIRLVKNTVCYRLREQDEGHLGGSYPNASE